MSAETIFEGREYEPSSWGWVADQVAEYEASGGTRANTLMDTGIPVIIVTSVGASSGKLRKFALMRVEHDGEYALIASKGGDRTHPAWYANLVAEPTVLIQDGAAAHPFTVRELSGAERDEWYARGAAVYAPYTEYAESAAGHGRVIPVFLATPATD